MKDASETMRVVGSQFGLTPSDRAGLDVADVSDKPALGAEGS
jgi:phage terminase small subunit